MLLRVVLSNVTPWDHDQCSLDRVAVDMDIHGYIHVWISDLAIPWIYPCVDIRLGHPVDISMDIFIYFNWND